MAFPRVAGTASSVESTAVTSHDVSLPSSIVVNDLLVAFFAYSGAFQAPTFPAGWTQVIHSNTNNIGATWAWRRADGSEGATIVVTTGAAARQSAHFVYKIKAGGLVQRPESRAFWSSGLSSTPNPDSYTPSGGAQDYLWLECVAADSGFVCSGASANYTDFATSDSGADVDASAALSVAQRALNAASEDPGALTLEGSEGWLAITVSIPPSTGYWLVPP